MLAQWSTALTDRWSARGAGAERTPTIPRTWSPTRSAREPRFAEAFAATPAGEPPTDPVRSVLPPERYATVLDELGFTRQHVRLQVYGHHHDTTADVVEWVKGTNLTRFQSVLPAEVYAEYLDRYRERLVEVLGDQRPYYYPFKRILLWGRR